MHSSFIVTFGGISSWIGAGAMVVDGYLGAAALLAVIGVVGLLVGASMAGIDVRARLTPSTTTAKRVATVAVVGLVVTTAALSGVGGPVSPVDTVQAGYFEGCEFSDSLTFAVGASLGLSNQDCAFWTPDTDTENITNTDAYASGLALNDSAESFLTTSENFNNDRRSVAWSKAKISIVNDLNNNVSEANATANAKEIVDGYYSTSMENTLRDWDAKGSQIIYLANATTPDGESQSTQVTKVSGGQRYWGAKAYVNYSLPDGRHINISAPVYKDSTYSAASAPYGDDLGPGISQADYVADFSIGDFDNSAPSAGSEIQVQDPSSGTNTTIVRVIRYENLLQEYNNQRQQVNANIDAYVNETYTAYESGEINSTDLAASDPQTIGTQAATDYNSTGYYGMASAQLAALGLSGNESVSHVVNTTEDGAPREITGTLFYTGEDSQNFTTGTEYDPSTLNGSVYMSVATIRDGNGTELNHSGGFYYVDENFTVVEATNTQTGEAVNTTTMETRDYTTTNASALAEEIDRLKDLRAYYESQKGGGGGFSLDFGGTGTGMLIALAAVVVLLAGTRD